MKKVIMKRVFYLLTVVICVVIYGSCRENAGSSDLVIQPPNPPGERQLAISVLNSNQDTLQGYVLTVKTPSGSIEKSVNTPKYLIQDPQAGIYSFTVSKDGYIKANKSITVILPHEETASLTIDQSIYLVRSASVISIAANAGGTVEVQKDPEQPSAALIGKITVPSAITFTMADGSNPTRVDISATNLPSEAVLSPKVMEEGQQQIELQPLEIVNNQIPIKKMEFQPEGLSFSKPVQVGMYIGDLYTDLSGDEKKAAQQNLSFNYLRTDGSTEQVAPDHFSMNFDSVYFKISHFSTWFIVDKRYKISQTQKWVTVESKLGECGEALNHCFKYKAFYDYDNAIFKRVLNFLGISAKIRPTISRCVNYPAVPGFSYSVTLQVYAWAYTVTDTRTKEKYEFNLLLPISSISKKLITCHNQGGN